MVNLSSGWGVEKKIERLRNDEYKLPDNQDKTKLNKISMLRIL